MIFVFFLPRKITLFVILHLGSTNTDTDLAIWQNSKNKTRHVVEMTIKIIYIIYKNLNNNNMKKIFK